MSGFIDRVGGIARLRITGVRPESVLNACALAGIELWGLNCVDECCIDVFAHESSLEDIRKICIRCMCGVSVLSIRGGSRWRKLARRRIWLIIAAAIIFLALVISSLFIWDFDVEGNEKLSSGEILRSLAECGVTEGTFWPGLPVDIIRSDIILKKPEIAWLTVNVSGSKATVLVEERAEKPEIYSESSAADIVASQSGVIRRLSVMNGKPLVSRGQTVMKGDVLVSGAMDSITGETRHVRALADVQAETWYERTAVCRLEEPIKTEKTKIARRFAIKLGKSRINFYFDSGKNIDGCDKITKEYKLGIKGLFTLPVSIITEQYVSYEYSAGGCCTARELEDRLKDWLENSIDGKIETISFSHAESGGLLLVTMRARCLENIAETAELPQPEGETYDREDN